MIHPMLNTKLYPKMFAEQELFEAKLMLLLPVGVLNRAYEYVCREDIPYNNLSSRQAPALLKSPIPLADLFQK